MFRIAPLVALLLAGLFPAAAGAQPPVRAQSAQTLAALFSHEDYPADSVRNYEQGSVSFRLDISAEGRPTECLVVQSSGSISLDSTTCRLLMERARFRPARDAEGKTASDRISGRIVWRLPVQAARSGYAFTLWRGCVLGEAAKYVLEDLAAGEIAQRSFPPCARLEALFARESSQAPPLREPRERVAALVADLMLESGKILNLRTAGEAEQRK
ncbi:MAG TPA: energy transducer TonB [Allosphingosinicella sp.]|jgi:TonB family protein